MQMREATPSADEAAADRAQPADDQDDENEDDHAVADLAGDQGLILACAVKRRAFQWVQGPPGNRSSRRQPEQLWRKRSG
jgi:hypothetical protein